MAHPQWLQWLHGPRETTHFPAKRQPDGIPSLVDTVKTMATTPPHRGTPGREVDARAAATAHHGGGVA